jgi:hypothetical protein
MSRFAFHILMYYIGVGDNDVLLHFGNMVVVPINQNFWPKAGTNWLYEMTIKENGGVY